MSKSQKLNPFTRDSPFGSSCLFPVLNLCGRCVKKGSLGNEAPPQTEEQERSPSGGEASLLVVRPPERPRLRQLLRLTDRNVLYVSR